MVNVGSGRVPIQASSPRNNWATGNELGQAHILKGRPRGLCGMEET